MHFGTRVANSTRLVNTSCPIEDIDENTKQNGMLTIFQDLSNKSWLAKHSIKKLIHP